MIYQPGRQYASFRQLLKCKLYKPNSSHVNQVHTVVYVRNVSAADPFQAVLLVQQPFTKNRRGVMKKNRPMEINTAEKDFNIG